MRVVENSQDRLVLRDRTAWMTVVCWSTALFYGGFAWSGGIADWRAALVPAFLVLCGLICLRTTLLELDRGQRTLTLKRLRIFRRTTNVIAFDEVSDVLVEADPMSDHPGSPLCRLCLVTRAGRVPTTESYEPGPERFSAMQEALRQALGRS